MNYFYGLGQRISQLTYRHNRIGGGSSDGSDSGLSDYGARILDRMNTLGMAVDVSQGMINQNLLTLTARTWKPLGRQGTDHARNIGTSEQRC